MAGPYKLTPLMRTPKKDGWFPFSQASVYFGP